MMIRPLVLQGKDMKSRFWKTSDSDSDYTVDYVIEMKEINDFKISTPKFIEEVLAAGFIYCSAT